MVNQRKHQLSIYQKLYLEMQRCRINLKSKLNEELQKNGLSISFDQWLVLQEIKLSQGINQKTIAQNLSKDVASVSRILRRLKDSDLVSKEVNPENTKEFKLYLKPKGLELMSSTEKQFDKIFKDQFSTVYEQEMNLMLDILSRIN